MPGFSSSQDYVIEYSIDGGQTWQHGRTVPGGAVADTDMRSIQRAAVRGQARDAHGNVESVTTRVLAEDDPRGVLNQPIAPRQSPALQELFARMADMGHHAESATPEYAALRKYAQATQDMTEYALRHGYGR